MSPTTFDAHREKITPDDARKFLLTNKNNRPINFDTVRIYANEMKLGHWKFNGDSFKIARSGRLMDGQHRLHAVVSSGVTIEAMVLRGLPDDIFDTLDVGRKRTGGDTFYIKGEKHWNVLSAALSLVRNYEDNRMSPRKTYPIPVLAETLEAHPLIRNSVEFCANNRAKLLPQSCMAALHYLFSQKDKLMADVDKLMADVFMEAVRTGTGLSITDTVYLLRERLIKNLSDKAKLPTPYIMALTIKAWNAERAGRKLRYLSFRGGEATPEEFPEIK